MQNLYSIYTLLRCSKHDIHKSPKKKSQKKNDIHVFFYLERCEPFTIAEVSFLYFGTCAEVSVFH